MAQRITHAVAVAMINLEAATHLYPVLLPLRMEQANAAGQPKFFTEDDLRPIGIAHDDKDNAFCAHCWYTHFQMNHINNTGRVDYKRKRPDAGSDLYAKRSKVET